MTQYNSLNVKLSNSQLNKLTSDIKDETEIVLRLSSNMIGDNEANFPHQLLLTNTQVSNLRKAFANNSSADIKLSKTQLSKIIQSGGFLGRLLGPLLKAGLPLIKNVIKQLAKTAASAAVAGIHKEVLGSGNNITLIMSNDEIEHIIKIVKSLADSGLLLEGVTQTVENEINEQKGGFLSMLLGALGVSILGNILTGGGIYRAGKGKGINRAGEGVLRAGNGSKMNF